MSCPESSYVLVPSTAEGLLTAGHASIGPTLAGPVKCAVQLATSAADAAPTRIPA